MRVVQAQPGIRADVCIGHEVPVNAECGRELLGVADLAGAGQCAGAGNIVLERPCRQQFDVQVVCEHIADRKRRPRAGVDADIAARRQTAPGIARAFIGIDVADSDAYQPVPGMQRGGGGSLRSKSQANRQGEARNCGDYPFGQAMFHCSAPEYFAGVSRV